MPSSSIKQAAVVGAGVMGAQIAAHLANAGIPALLFDLTAAIAGDGLKRAIALKPSPLFTRDAASLITVAGLDRDLSRLAEADWIVEAIVERLDAKQALLAQVDATRHPGAIVSSNTSGIPIATLAAGRSDDFRRHWLGTHFFNPPRYLRLLEVIPTGETAPDVLDALVSFADHRLGKGVVIANDSPNFIANHIGLYGVAQAFRALDSGEYTIEDIDAITGSAIGRPRSATFRTMDIAGLDVLGHVARNLSDRLGASAAAQTLALTPLVQTLIDRGWVGEKAGQGFYKREGDQILTLDPAALTYRPRQTPRLPSLEAARSIEDVGERVRALFQGDDKVGRFLRATLAPMLVYTARVAPGIAHAIDDVDRAMRWGFGWELGPFELWDAIGVQTVMAAVSEADRNAPPPLVAELLAANRDRFRDGPLPPAGPGLQILKSAKARRGTLRRNPGASLVDLGDGVLAVEFHSKMNAIGPDTVQMLHAGLKEASVNFQAFVIGNEAADFSAGANLMLILLEAQEGNWDEIDLMVRAFQDVTQAIRYADVPVIAAPAGVALAGGCEIVVHASRVQAAAETYMGLVETGVGLIPAGGGCLEMLARAVEAIPDAKADLLPFVQPVFETIAFAKVSTSAADARRLGYLRPFDGVTMNRDRVIADAKAMGLELVREEYRPPARRAAVPVGGEGLLAALKLGIHLAWRAGRISDHDATIARALARVLAGGDLPHQTVVSETYLLELEREAFLKLCGEPRTRDRMQHMLKTGKALRN